MQQTGTHTALSTCMFQGTCRTINYKFFFLINFLTFKQGMRPCYALFIQVIQNTCNTNEFVRNYELQVVVHNLCGLYHKTTSRES